jgi:hypothetical protein
MSKIAQLDSSYDLWLTYSWSNNNHGICGHTYEVIDYFYILKDHFKVGILICEDTDWDTFEKSIRSKYAFTEQEILEYKNNIVFLNRPRLLKGKNILFTDGGIINTRDLTLLFDNVIYFACGNKEVKNNIKNNSWILQDDRVYDPVKCNGVNYKKKILFEKLKSIGVSKDAALVYATKNCRNLDNYEELSQYGNNILAITNKENKPKDIQGVTFVIPPVAELFEQFTTYVYTPVKRKWDCSPRFIAECKYYGKQVIYHNIDYWDTDLGLYWRKWDIDNDFKSLFLTSDDEIITIIKRIINL